MLVPLLYILVLVVLIVLSSSMVAVVVGAAAAQKKKKERDAQESRTPQTVNVCTWDSIIPTPIIHFNHAQRSVGVSPLQIMRSGAGAWTQTHRQ